MTSRNPLRAASDEAAGAVGDGLDAPAKTRGEAPDNSQAQAEGTLVLLADDHPTNCLLLFRLLNRLGYAAETAENGVEALVKWGSGRFALLITDCNMPGMNGYKLARLIREAESADGGRRIPIIACTAIALEGEAEACLAAGMDDYLAKPFEFTSLAKKLDKWLPLAQTQAAAPADLSLLAAICGGDAAAEREILTDFRRVNDADVVMLQLAVDSRDAPRVTHASHRIKGSSSMIGADALAGVCERLERAGRAGDWNAIEKDMGAFQRELARLNAYCEQPP